MKRNAFHALGTALLILCLVAGCGYSRGLTAQTPAPLGSGDPSRTAVTLYYRDEKGYIIPVSRRIRPMGDIASEVLYAQLANAENCCIVDPLGLKPVLSRKFAFRVDVEENVAKVDIVSGTLKPKDARDERDMVNCIVNSLCSLEGVNGVTLAVDGKPVKTLANGTDAAGVMLPRPLNEIYASARAEEDVTCTLYFISGQSEMLAPVTMHYEKLPTLREALNTMIKPKSEYGLSSVFPTGSKLIGANVEQGVGKLDFSRDFANLAEYPELESRVLIALNSVCHELAHTDMIQITVEGAEYRPVLDFWPDAETVAAFNTLGEEYDTY